jgi:hypothetical protein
VATWDPAGTERALQADHALLHGGLILSFPLAFFRARLLLFTGEVCELLQRITRRCEALNPFDIFGIFLDQFIEIPIQVKRRRTRGGVKPPMIDGGDCGCEL